MPTSHADSLWKQIAADLEDQIRSRALAPGDRIPTELELGRKYMVNRHSVRRAFKDLQSRGLLDASQGRGRFVRRFAGSYLVKPKGRFHRDTRAAGVEPRAITRQLTSTLARGEVAQHLKVAERTPVTVLERLMGIDDFIVSVNRHYISIVEPHAFIEAYGRLGSISDSLAECGIDDFERSWTRVGARLPTPAEMALLNTPAHVPLLEISALNLTPAGLPVEYIEVRAPADRMDVRFAYAASPSVATGPA